MTRVTSWRGDSRAGTEKGAKMYEPRVRTPGQEPIAAAHAGTAADFLRRHRREAAVAAHADQRARHAFAAGLFERVADTRNLYAAYAHVRSHGGDAPGVDGLRPSQVDPEGAWEMVRQVRATLFDETYRPARVRKQKIPKTSGPGFRTLSIPTLVDRVVQRALVQVIEPYLDPHFDDNSFGYRRGRGRLQALARAQWYTVEQDRGIWITEDLKNAFDMVPQKRLLDIIRTRLPDERVMRLIELFVVTASGHGVPQGGPASALWLNIYLDHLLDRVWHQRHPDVPLVRVADDLLLVCKDTVAAQQMYAELETVIAPTGMGLKLGSASAIRDLRAGQVAEWLGYRIRSTGNELVYDVADRSWQSLTLKLELAHEKPLAPLVALDTIAGWVAQLGPGYAERKVAGTYTRVRQIAREQGFEEVPRLKDFHTNWLAAHNRWLEVWNEECRRRSVTNHPINQNTGDRS